MMRLISLGSRVVIAHRGASLELPENTLAAFQRALDLGADALELDVRLSRDGVAVVIHDATLDRTTRHGGPVRNLGAKELSGLDVPALADVLDAFPAAELLIEIKEAAAQQPVADAIRRASAEHRSVVAAAADAALTLFRGGMIPVCGSRSDIAALRWRSAFSLPFAPARCAALSVPIRYRGIPLATRSLFRTAADAGIPVHVWTIDEPEIARRLWSIGATGMVTNDPARLIAARDR